MIISLMLCVCINKERSLVTVIIDLVFVENETKQSSTLLKAVTLELNWLALVQNWALPSTLAVFERLKNHNVANMDKFLVLFLVCNWFSPLQSQKYH